MLAARRRAFTVFAALCLGLSFCHARITDSSLERDIRKTVLIVEPFGFSENGHIDLEVTSFIAYHLKDTKVDYSQLGFFITTSEAEAQLEVDFAADTCALDAENTAKLLTFDKVFADSQKGSGGSNSSSLLSDHVDKFSGGEFSLFFANCLSPGTAVSFDVRTSLYNVKNGNFDYLSVGEDNLPTLYMVAFVLFTAATAAWSTVVFRARQNSHRIHYLMIALVACKALTLLSQAGMYHLIRITGHPDGWNIAYYVFTFMRGILFFTVVVLVGTGWSYMKPLLAEKEKRILMIVIPLQVFAEVAIVILDENTPASRNWFTWRDMLHLVDIICCCAILFPIVWSIKHLREASQTDGKAARNLAKLQLFQHFYVMVVVYIYFTRIVVYLLKSTMPYHLIWLSDAADVGATLVFYVATATKFRPHAENPYFNLSQDDELAETADP